MRTELRFTLIFAFICGAIFIIFEFFSVAGKIDEKLIMDSVRAVVGNEPKIRGKFDGDYEEGDIPTFCVGVLTWNRKQYVEIQAESLRFQNSLDEDEFPEGRFIFVVFDDASDDYTHDDLKEWYPMAKKVFNMRKLNPGRERKGGGRANENTRFMHEFFLRHPGCEYIITADSDLVFHPFWARRLVAAITDAPKWRGKALYSLYNSCFHGNIECNTNICSKSDVGNAGTVWPRKIIEEVRDAAAKGGKFDNGSFDWQYSKYIKDNPNLQMFALKPSMMEHLGYKGSNYPITKAETSRDFPWFDLPKSIRDKVLRNLQERDTCDNSKMKLVTW